MKHFKIKTNIMGQAMALSLAVLGLASCGSEGGVSTPDDPSPGDSRGDSSYTEAWHDKMRTMPYPKLDNQLVINPSPLIVPQSMKTKDSIQFELSQSKDFGGTATNVPAVYASSASRQAASGGVIRSKMQVWCMFNPHQVLNQGTWYWRYRQKSKGGEPTGWSEPIEFKVDASATQFVTPSFEAFARHAVPSYPRLYCFLDADLKKARQNVASMKEYSRMTSAAESALNIDVDGMSDPYREATDGYLKQYVSALYTAYMLTLDSRYADKMQAILKKLLATPPSDATLFRDNFASTDIALCIIPEYDALHDRLTTSQQRQAERIMMQLLRYYYPKQTTYEENHIFDNHFWQQNMRVLMQCAFLLYDNPSYRAEVLPMLEYYYELWTARAPAMGFNRDGGWENGTKYFINNVETLSYVPMLFGYMSGGDFLGHPWYRNAGETIVYTWPPQSNTLGFGDGWEWYSTPQYQRVAYADFLARELGDAYAGWYAQQQVSTLRRDTDLRLYRMARFEKDGYLAELPADRPKLKWMEDMGEVMMHSSIDNTANDFALSFRSSTFGSGSHTLADQNSFNVLYKGSYVYCSTGYYQNFDDRHNLLSYRHTRAHNTILVDGIGQPFSTKGYGDVVRAMGGDHIGYCLGDASHAYSGVSDDQMWIDAFRNAGVTQTAAYGFGTTPLTKYRRHVLMLYPDIIVVYDELEASSAVRWDWLLHSLVRFDIDNSAHTLTTENASAGYVARTQLFSDDAMTLSETDKFFADPATGITDRYPAQWHMTASIAAKNATRVLAVMQVAGSKDGLKTVTRSGNTFRVGNWTIEAVMQVSSRAALKISNSAQPGVSFVYDAATNSTLHDTVAGVSRTQSQTDHKAVKSRGL